MPHKSGDADNPQTWLKNAISDLRLSRIELPEGVMYEQLCFHAQQAAEKSIKALLLYLDIKFTLTHSIQLLISLLPPEFQSLSVIKEAVILTPYAVLTRYPGEMEPVTAKKHSEAVMIATCAVEWIQAYINKN